MTIHDFLIAVAMRSCWPSRLAVSSVGVGEAIARLVTASLQLKPLPSVVAAPNSCRTLGHQRGDHRPLAISNRPSSRIRSASATRCGWAGSALSQCSS
jgi:hypothetical protein